LADTAISWPESLLLESGQFPGATAKRRCVGISINYLEFEAIEIWIADSLPQSKELSRAAIAHPVLKDFARNSAGRP
jgi:hypothetical protein